MITECSFFIVLNSDLKPYLFNTEIEKFKRNFNFGYLTSKRSVFWKENVICISKCFILKRSFFLLTFSTDNNRNWHVGEENIPGELYIDVENNNLVRIFGNKGHCYVLRCKNT